jgi:hypothetical protein
MLTSPLSLLTGLLAASAVLVDAAPVGKRCSATINSIKDGARQRPL